MRKIFTSKPFVYGSSLVTSLTVLAGSVMAQAGQPTIAVSQQALGFKIPSLGDLLTFGIRVFFVIAGLTALLYLLLGAFGWVTSGGDKEAVKKAREKIQAAVVGVVLIVAVLAIIVTMETFVFVKRICFGLSCPVTIPGLLERCGGPGEQACPAVTR